MIDVVYTENKEQLSPNSFDQVYSLIGSSAKSKAGSYRRWQDRQAFLLGRLLLVKLLVKYNYDPELLRKVEYSNFNRPFIPGAPFDFNISHSGGFVICALSADQVVGVDIEHVQTVDLDDFDRILNDADRSRIVRSEDKMQAFFRIWSAKEAVLKANGCGLVEDIFKLEVETDTALFEGRNYHLKDIMIDPLYSCCIASDTPIEEVYVEKILAEELYF